MLAVWRRVWDDGGMESIPSIAMCAACAVLSSCQIAPVTTSFYKPIDARNKSIALPRSSDHEPVKLELFRNALRSYGWRIVVANVAEGNGEVKYNNSGAKYTLIGEGHSALARAEAATALFGPFALLFPNAGRINFTLIESKTGDEVMNVAGSEKKWKPEDTAREMTEHAR